MVQRKRCLTNSSNGRHCIFNSLFRFSLPWPWMESLLSNSNLAPFSFSNSWGWSTLSRRSFWLLFYELEPTSSASSVFITFSSSESFYSYSPLSSCSSPLDDPEPDELLPLPDWEDSFSFSSYMVSNSYPSCGSSAFFLTALAGAGGGCGGPAGVWVSSTSSGTWFCGSPPSRTTSPGLMSTVAGAGTFLIT